MKLTDIVNQHPPVFPFEGETDNLQFPLPIYGELRKHTLQTVLTTAKDNDAVIKMIELVKTGKLNITLENVLSHFFRTWLMRTLKITLQAMEQYASIGDLFETITGIHDQRTLNKRFADNLPLMSITSNNKENFDYFVQVVLQESKNSSDVNIGDLPDIIKATKRLPAGDDFSSFLSGLSRL